MLSLLTFQRTITHFCNDFDFFNKFKCRGKWEEKRKEKKKGMSEFIFDSERVKSIIKKRIYTYIIAQVIFYVLKEKYNSSKNCHQIFKHFEIETGQN